MTHDVWQIKERDLTRNRQSEWHVTAIQWWSDLRNGEEGEEGEEEEDGDNDDSE